MEVDGGFDGLISADVRDCLVVWWCRGVEKGSRQCAGKYGVPRARLKGEESDLFSLAVELFVFVHCCVVGVLDG